MMKDNEAEQCHGDLARERPKMQKTHQFRSLPINVARQRFRQSTNRHCFGLLERVSKTIE